MLDKETNLKTLDERISDLELEGNIVISFDFDELLVPIHLTREVGAKVQIKPKDNKILEELGADSFEGIKYLNSLRYGLDLNKYTQIRDNMAKETPWTTGFDYLLKDLMKDYSVIIISSGMKDICNAKLKEIDFNPKNIIGGELKIEDNKLSEPNLIISDKVKGYIVNKLQKDYTVIGVGHSIGDKPMLDEADMSISVNSKIPNLAQYNVKSPKEILDIVKDIVVTYRIFSS
ncbi:MAG: hypothetical protein JSW73_02660 [Candidatus Woesearchaeota archaeon]|nr:MAG: hypothetical protein JSW73_02660 [Candidatus Woesearchaeota archaeon]